MFQVKSGWDNGRIMDINRLEEKLARLRRELHELETVGAEEIRLKRILADMGDDYRENEGAKLVMDQHNLWFVRKLELKKEIVLIKKQIIAGKK